MIRRLPVEFADSAKADLENLTDHIAIAAGSYRIAINFVARIEARCNRIANAPHIGRPRDDLSPGLRTLPFERSAIIAYVVDADLVRIINIFYGGRDFESLIRGADTNDTV